MPDPPASAPRPGELRVTQGSIITEDSGEFMGLPGASIFAPMVVFLFAQAAADNFLLSAGACGATFLTIKLWLRGKPSHFLRFWLWERAAPKVYRHRLSD